MANQSVKEAFTQNPYPSTTQLQKLFDSSLDVICIIDACGSFIHVSPASVKVWGYAPEEMIGRPYTDFVVTEDLARTEKAMKRMLDGIDVGRMENRYRRKDGCAVTMEWRGQWDAKEQSIFCIVRDVSEHQTRENLQAIYEQKMKKQNYEMREILERIADGFFAMDEDWRIIYANPQVEEILTINREDYLTRSFWECFPDMIGSEYYVQYHKAMDTKQPVHFESFFPPFNGWFSVDAYPSKTGLSVFFRNCTEQKKLEERKKLYEDNLKIQQQAMVEVLEQMSEGFVSLDNNSTVLYWNKKAELLSGLPREAVLDKIIWDVFPHMMEEEYYQLYQQYSSLPRPIHTEVFTNRFQKWVELHIYPTVKGVSVFFRDITGRKNAEQERINYEKKIEQQNKQLLDLIDGMKEGFYFLNNHFEVKQWNRRMAAISKISSKEILGKVLTDQIPESGRSFYTSLFEKVKKEQKPFHKEFQDPVKQIWLDVSIYPSTEGLSVFVTDITEERKEEEQVRRLSLIATETSNAVCYADRESKITWINAAFTRMTGYSPDEAIGRKTSELLSGPETSEETIHLLKECYLHKQSFHTEMINYKKDGEKFWVELYGQPLFDRKGNVEQYFCIRTDITERKKSEEELRKLSLVAQLTDNIVSLTSPDHKIIWVNDAFTRITGYTAEEVIGKTATEVYDGPETDAHTLNYVNERWSDCQPFHIEVLNYKKNGESYWAEVASYPVFDAKGKLQHFFSIASDITERRKMQQVLDEEKEKRQQMITAAVIAAQEKERGQVGRELHDNVNQVLTTVKLYTELCGDGVGDTKEMLNKSIKFLQQSIDEIRSLSKRLSAPTLGNIRLKDSVKELLDTISATNKIAIHVNDSAIGSLEIKQEIHLAIYRIIQEQLTNILKYAEAQNVDVNFNVSNRTLILQIKDDGKGFDPAQKRNGVGITNMITRAQSQKGKLKITSAPGTGCEVKVSFPLY